MATSAIPSYQRNGTGTKTSPEVLESASTCPPSSFPDKFQDFFAALTEDVDDLPSMLEDKLIPRKQDFSSTDSRSKRWGKRTFQRRSSEVEVLLHRTSFSGGQGHTPVDGPKSPTSSRRRSSSIGVARPTPDLNRFLQTEAGPWGHLSPSTRSPTRTSAISPGAIITSTSYLNPGTSPGGPSPTSPAGSASASRGPPPKQYRSRTSSMPAVPRHRPMLAETKRSGIAGTEEHEIEDGIEYYRLRSFSITANGVFNLGDSLRSRRSRSINSVTSSGTSCSSTRDGRLLSSASQLSATECEDEANNSQVATYKVGMLGASGVGKTALTVQFTTSEYICAYDASLGLTIQRQKLYTAIVYYRGFGYTTRTKARTIIDPSWIRFNRGKVPVLLTDPDASCGAEDVNQKISVLAVADEEYGQKTVSVMLDGQETELEIIDHPASEMSVEAFCSTYSPDVYVIVYSVVDRRSLKVAEETLLYLWKSDCIATHGVILVGNKADLERKREVPLSVGRRLANTCGCKFIETSSGLAHHVDELLVGILAQVKLNPQRNRDRASRRRRSKHHRRILKHLLGIKRKTKSCENLFTL